MAFPGGPYDFDIDVDLSHELGDGENSVVVDDRWYRMSHPRPGRCPRIQKRMDKMYRNALLNAQWEATRRRPLDRRRAIRTPLLSRVHIEGNEHMTATNISLSGLCVSGTPKAPIMDIEFKIPGAVFPIDAMVEVMNYKDSPVIPLVGLRFVRIEQPYVDQIAHYIARKRSKAA